MSAKRKPLDERFEEFVYGESGSQDAVEPEEKILAVETTEPVPSDKAAEVGNVSAGKKRQAKGSESLLDKLMVGEPDDLKPITLNLPLSMHRKLKTLSGRTGRNKSEIIRFALDSLFLELEE